MRVRIATRGSELARWQAQRVGELLGDYELVVVHTTGDRDQSSSLAAIGGQGVFVKEVQAAVLRGEADVAVHSAKDLPSGQSLLELAAVLERADVRDALVGADLRALARGARVGTSAPRRQAQLRVLRPDLDVVSIRGNVRTRLARVGELDAVVMAVAALERLGIAEPRWWPIPEEVLCPQAGQGAIAVECRSDLAVAERVRALDHEGTRAEVTAERAVLAAFGTGCAIPLGVRARHVDGALEVRAVAVAPDGSRQLEACRRGGEPEALGREVAAALEALGARELLAHEEGR